MESVARALMNGRMKKTLGSPVSRELYMPVLDELLFFKESKVSPGAELARKLLKKLFFPRDAFVYMDPEAFCRQEFPEVWKAQHEARKNGGLSGAYQFVRLMELALLIRHFRPSSYLELGSGASSCLVAHILNDPTKLTTVEESAEWHKKFTSYAAPFLDRMVSLRADRIKGEKDGELVCWYNIDHSKYHDLVYVDGPYSRVDEADAAKTHMKCRHMADYDIGKLWEAGVYPRVIVLDNRKPSLRRLLLDGGSRYDVYFNSTVMEGLTLFPPLFPQYHHVMVLKEGAR